MTYQFFPSDKTENDKFKAIVDSRVSQPYLPSFKATSTIGISPRALSKITSSFMVLTSDHQKNNLGLSIKFEAKGLKVIDYSRKTGRYWEFSDKAIDLIREYKVGPVQIVFELQLSHCRINSQEYSRFWTKQAMVSCWIRQQFFNLISKMLDMARATDIFDGHADAKVKEVKSWLKSKGVRDLEPVSLFSDYLAKVYQSHPWSQES